MALPLSQGLLSLTFCEKAGPRTMESRDSPEGAIFPPSLHDMTLSPSVSDHLSCFQTSPPSSHATLPARTHLLTLLTGRAFSRAHHPQVLGDGPEGDVRDRPRVLGWRPRSAPRSGTSWPARSLIADIASWRSTGSVALPRCG